MATRVDNTAPSIEVERLRELRFVIRYLETHNAAQAYREVWQPEDPYHGKYNQCGTRAADVLRRPRVRGLLQDALGEAMEQIDVTAERIVKELAAIAFADPADLYTTTGALKPIHEMPEHVRRSITDLESRQVFGDDEDATTKKVKRESKLKALELLGKMFSLWVDRVQVEESTGPQVRATELDLQDRVNLLLGKTTMQEVTATIVDELEPEEPTAAGVFDL